jgi:hypothetical protein
MPIGLIVGGVAVVGVFLVRMLRKQRAPRLDDLGVISGQWIAQQRAQSHDPGH